MYKKILSLLIAAFCLLSSFGTSVLAQDETVVSADGDLISVINAINPAYTLPEDAEYFTRIEFVKLLIDVMCSQGTQPAETIFSDVPSSHRGAASLKFAVDFGIISQAQMFYPENNVTYTQAIKMAVTAAGYKPLADAKGGYPTGYLSIASDIGLDDDIELKGEMPLSINDGLKIICNLFDAKVFVQTGFSDSPVYETQDGVTFLYNYHKISTVYGVVNANEYSSLTDADAGLSDGKIRIGTVDYKAKNDFNEFLGFNVKAYVTKDNEVIYLSPYEVDKVILVASDIDRADGFKLVTFTDNKEKKYTLDSAFKYIKNGKASPVLSSDFTSYFDFDTGFITLIDNNRDNKFDVAKVTSYTYSLVSKVSLYENIIYDANSSANSINLTDADYIIKNVIDDVTTQISLSDLSSGILIAYSKSDDGKLYDIIVCNDYIDGKITAVDATNNLIFINGTSYEVSEYYTNYYSHISIGADGSFAIGIDGKLAAVAASGEDYMRYGWFVGFSNSDGLDKPLLKIFSQSGEMQVLTLSSKVLVNNVSLASSNAKAFMESLSDTERLIKYSINQDNELKKIDTYIAALDNEFELGGKNPNDSLTHFITGNYRFKSGINLFAATSANTFSFHIEGNTYNFVIPPAGPDRNDDSKYSIVSSSYYGNDYTYNGISAFDVNKSGCADATLYFADNRISFGLSEETATAVIEKVTQGLDPEGNNALVVYVWRSNRYSIYYSDPSTYNYINALNPGDLVRLVADSNNIIVDIVRDFNVSTYQISDDRKSIGGLAEYVMGISYGASEKYVNLITNPQVINHRLQMPSSYSMSNIRNISVSGAPVVYVDLVKRSDGTVVSALPRMSEITDIKSYLDSGDDASFIISRQRYLSPALTVIYNVEVK